LAFFVIVPSISVFAQDRNVLASQIDTAEVYITNTSDIAAYHSRLPLSTMLRVTNLDNFKSVEVRLMGRRTGNPGEVILLSEEAARILGFSGSEQIPVRVDVISNPSAATLPPDPPEDSYADAEPFNGYETEDSPSTASGYPWDDEEAEDEYPDYSAEPAPRPPVVSVEPAPARPAPQPPTRTVPPDQQPRPAAATRPGQSGTESSAQQNIKITVNINGRDYVVEIPADGQTPPRAVPATPPASYPYPPGVSPGTTYYIPPDVMYFTPYEAPPPPVASPLPPPLPPSPPPPPTVLPPSPPPPPSSYTGNAATIIPSIPDPNSNAVYRVQVGYFGNRNLARAVYDRLRDAGFSPAYEPYNDMYRVVISGVRAADIPSVARRLGAAGFSSAWIRKEN
jgi:rare lipoprotein A (peptidoglycan hydrolase)